MVLGHYVEGDDHSVDIDSLLNRKLLKLFEECNNIDVYFLTVCQAKVDLAFVIDGSGSIEAYGKGNFRRCLNFVKRMIVSFKISKRFTRVGIVLFSYRARRIFDFNTYSRRRDILRAIDKIKYPSGGTKTGLAMSYAQRTLFRSRRSRRKQVMIVMTDGRSQDVVSGPARALKRRRIEIFAVGIGRHYNIRQLFQIASSRRHVYTSGFRNLASIVRVIKKKACSGKIQYFIVYSGNKFTVPFLVFFFFIIQRKHFVFRQQWFSCLFKYLRLLFRVFYKQMYSQRSEAELTRPT